MEREALEEKDRLWTTAAATPALHIDVSHLNVCATFYYLCSILDGYGRFLVHWALRESMTEADIEIIRERARERYPGLGRE